MSPNKHLTLLTIIFLTFIAGCGDTAEVCEGPLIDDEPPNDEQFLGLSAAQHDAIVHLSGTLDGRSVHCSGTWISGGFVITAQHCLPVVEAADAAVTSSDMTATVEAAILHPTQDVMLLGVRWDDPPPSSLAILDEALGDEWIGRFGVAAGYGRTERFLGGGLHFSVQTITSIEENRVGVEGVGDFGVCAGDSGGPLLVRDGRGAVRIGGILSTSSTNCRRSGHYTRVDAVADWLADEGVELGGQPSECGAVNLVVYCDGGRAIWCDDDAVVVQACAQACGWDETRRGFGCMEAADPCDGIGRGRCDGDLLLRCDEGSIEQLDCAACGGTCGFNPGDAQAGCIQKE
jgi:hypothetical protein